MDLDKLDKAAVRVVFILYIVFISALIGRFVYFQAISSNAKEIQCKEKVGTND